MTPSCSSLPQIRLHSTRFCVNVRSATRLSRGAARFRARACAVPRDKREQRGAIPGAGSHRAARGYRAARHDSRRRCAPRCAVIVRRGAISGAGLRRAARSSRGAAKLLALARAALRGHRAAWRDFGRGFALRCTATARVNAFPGAGSRRAARLNAFLGAGSRRAAR